MIILPCRKISHLYLAENGLEAKTGKGLWMGTGNYIHQIFHMSVRGCDCFKSDIFGIQIC